MITISAEISALRQVRTMLAAVGDSIWGDRVGFETLAKHEYPAVVYSLVSASYPRESQRMGAIINLDVKVVAYSALEASAGQAYLYELFQHAGTQDAKPRFPNDSAWEVVTSTVDEGIFYTEFESEIRPIYHAGAQVELKMEAR